MAFIQPASEKARAMESERRELSGGRNMARAKTGLAKKESSFRLARSTDFRKAFESALQELVDAAPNGTILDFDPVVAETAKMLGHQFLFSFPAEKFPFKCEHAACVRCRHGEDEQEFFYVYRKDDDSPFEIATKDMLDWEFLEFADAYVSVLEQLRDGLEARLQKHKKPL